MKRRALVTGALGAPAVWLPGCAAVAPPAPAADAARLTVLYDAFGNDPALQPDWGYAAFIEAGGRRILFDTGNDPAVLARNVKARQVDLARLDFVVMSHRHGDHMGGLSHLLALNPSVPIYAPKEGFGVYGGDLPGSFYRRDESLPAERRYFGGQPPALMRFGSAWPQANLRLIDKTTQVAPGVHLIALVSDKPGTLELRELSLALETEQGMIVVVGCSHTGVDNIVRSAASIRPPVRLLAGGFHLVVAKDAEIEGLASALRDTLQVAYVAPGHCTGEPTFTALQRSFGERCLYAGLGSTLSWDGTPRRLADAHGRDPTGDADPLTGYRALLARSAQGRRRLFTDLALAQPGDAAYLAAWRRSRSGCC